MARDGEWMGIVRFEQGTAAGEEEQEEKSEAQVKMRDTYLDGTRLTASHTSLDSARQLTLAVFTLPIGVSVFTSRA